jgi:hypothetical protein
VVFVLKGGKYLPRYFNLLHSKVGNVNINRTALICNYINKPNFVPL